MKTGERLLHTQSLCHIMRKLEVSHLHQDFPQIV